MARLPEGYDELVDEITRDLELDAQYAVHLEPWDAENIKSVRMAGRAAARRLGHRVITHQSRPEERDDGRVVVMVALRGGDLSPEGQERYELRLLDALDRLDGLNPQD